MPEQVLLDNDVALKVACYYLVGEMVDVTTLDDTPAAMLGVARFVIQGRLNRASNVADVERAKAAFGKLLAAVTLLEPDDETWWSKELTHYRSTGFRTDVQVVTQDPWLAEVERETAVRAVLGLEPLSTPGSSARRHILAASPRARLWARLAALEQRAAGHLVAVLDSPPTDPNSVEIDTSVHPQAYAAGVGIPRCPGAFGGTTVVVLPATTPPEEIEAWFAIVKDDPVNKRDRFSRMRVATATGERSLLAVLRELHREGRRNVLVVPATFAADEESMRSLRRSVRELEDRMTLRWLPGLGAPTR